MPNQFSSGKYSIAECDRCGFRYKLKELKSLTIKLKPTAILVCPTCWEPDHPQLQLGMYPVEDPQAVRNPRPDNSYYIPSTGSRIFEWGWGPVGGASSYDSALTPNSLIAVVQQGSVTVL